MFRRNLSAILITIAMALTILNYDIPPDFNSREFWLLTIALIVLAAAIISIYKNEKSNKKQ